MVDGLKPGQRKVIFGAFKKKIAGELKVKDAANMNAKQCPVAQE